MSTSWVSQEKFDAVYNKMEALKEACEVAKEHLFHDIEAVDDEEEEGLINSAIDEINEALEMPED